MDTRDSKAAAPPERTGPAAQPAAPQAAVGSAPAERGAEQPRPANQGSPAAPVMKQFAKTEAESTGRDATDE